MTADLVGRPVQLRLPVVVVATHVSARHEETVAVFRYDPADPAAVSVGFNGGPSIVFARDLLAWGLRDKTPRVGAVLVWRSLHNRGRLMVRVKSNPGWALLEFAAADVTAFLARTWERVPLGAETYDVDWDSFDWAGGAS